MALKIPVPDTAWSSSTISLGGITYEFVFSFNERDRSSEDPLVQGRWRMSIYRDSVPVRLGIKIVESSLFLSRYVLEDFDHGDIGCFRMKVDHLPVGRNNLGLNKPYELIYFSNEEIQTILEG